MNVPDPSMSIAELIERALAADNDVTLWLFTGAVCGRIYGYAKEEAEELWDAGHRHDVERTREILHRLKD